MIWNIFNYICVFVETQGETYKEIQTKKLDTYIKFLIIVLN